MNRRDFLGYMQGFLLTALYPLNVAGSTQSTLRFASATDSAPISYQTASGDSGGYLPDLVRACCASSESLDCRVELFPWSRAQWMVREGAADAFCTYPSDTRKAYALFTQTPLFTMNFGNLVFRHDHPRKAELINAKSWDDLKTFTLVGQQDTDWETENIPPIIRRSLYSDQQEMMQVLLRRGEGDFLVMSSLEASHLLKTLNLTNKAQQQPVTFIDNSLIPFHIGISKQRDDAAELVQYLDGRIQSTEYQTEKRRIDHQYGVHI
ncbi:substrate-binding periplasmic protein [Reinekea blandensis]|uniref:Extracellular solute-binding protein, family 3/sensory box histidine kinase n=1 Tax=Reinekea blandensis MED297 TaxID=314283 RepID=A4BEL1_9GAMM|nr:transporter substrate-binding domain-containing protein [Reinekea blandensis]EAR09438.1 extracellular solute-binding protein, family 3/sensory box histidine kinase [Reinekea sp. MED297] [Reinekea blandensis MED297]